ncbi:MAG: lytic transglycosylase domain-containing protein [Acidimicrobiales bacterium]|nr:lytic transglycosylase domain-containing protein [Acidimicrobiales bacterium]
MRYKGLSVLLGMFVIVSTTVVGAQADAPPAFPEAETLATDGAAIDEILATVGLDAAWRSTLDLHPAARLLTIEYRDQEGDAVIALLSTTLQLGNTTNAREQVIADLRGMAARLDEAAEEQRRREIDRNRADAHFRGMHALTQAAAVHVFAGTDPAIDAVLGLDGEALTIAQREYLLTNATLDELFALRAEAATELELAEAALDAAITYHDDVEAQHAALIDDAAALAAARRELDASAREMLAPAAKAYALAAVPGQPGLTPRALDAYLEAEATMSVLAPSCHVSWRTIAAIASVESRHGEYGGGRLHLDGRPAAPIIGIALDGRTVDNFGLTTAKLADTDGGEFDGDPLFDRAVGPLQFIPESWQRWQLDADDDGERDPQDIDDAALSAGAYLCNYGSLRYWEGWQTAVFGYNHAGAYVNSVKAALDRVQRLRLPEFEGDEDLRQRIPYGTWVPMPEEVDEPTDEEPVSAESE